MEAAKKPVMDALAQKSRCGTVSNVPSGMVPESDTANLSILSYDPKIYSKGRSPLEAMSLGLTMEPEDTAIRCNVVTLSGTGCLCSVDRKVKTRGQRYFSDFFREFLLIFPSVPRIVVTAFFSA